MIPVIEVVRTEIKNLNSLCMVYTAVNSELGRQYEILRAGGTVLNETRTVDHYGWKQIKQEWIENCRLMLSKPRYLKNIEEYGMRPEVALRIANQKNLATFVEMVLNVCDDAEMASVLVEWTFLLQKNSLHHGKLACFQINFK
ncbi:unnamed protein product [Brugia pahangi]|uniref:GatB_N domain-containing protein n=1 Tax=Brugia pahangi TaxID=6280 RepID=A0A0N4T726_BRUPA|nr:unnamed protein product [Brugia pahangi]